MGLRRESAPYQQRLGRPALSKRMYRVVGLGKAPELRGFLDAYNQALPPDKRTPQAEAWFIGAQVFANRIDPPPSLRRWLENSNHLTKCWSEWPRRRSALPKRRRSSKSDNGNHGHAPSSAAYPFWLRHGRQLPRSYSVAGGDRAIRQNAEDPAPFGTRPSAFAGATYRGPAVVARGGFEPPTFGL